MVILAGVLCASTALADTKVKKFFGLVFVKHSWKFTGVSGCTYPGAGASTPPGPSPHLGVGVCSYSFPAVGSEIHSPSIDGCTGGTFGAKTIQSGGCVGGALFSSAIATTKDAFAGLAVAANDTSSSKDSLAVNVTQGATSVTLGNIRGRMLARASSKGEVGMGSIILAVYPDSNAANADVDNSGAGAVFFGRAYFNSAGNINLAPAPGIPGFTGSDFGVPGVDGSGNSFVALTGSTKNVNVPNGNNAAVVLISDPANGLIVPGASPVVLVTVSLLLAITGGVILSTRMRARVA
jgi:hypothetical protein